MKKLSSQNTLKRKDWYLCTGDDFLAIGLFVDAMKKQYDVLSIFEYTLEEEITVESLCAELTTISFLSEKRLFIIKGFPFYYKQADTENTDTPLKSQEIKGQVREQMLWNACGQTDSTICIIFIAPAFTKRGIAKEVMEAVTMKEFLLHAGDTIPKTMYDESFTQEQRQFLFDRVGHDQQEYRKAMERLFLYQSSKKLSKEVMFQLVPAAVSDDVFLCVSYLFQRKHQKAMEIIEKKIRYGESFLPLLGAIIWQAEQMFIVAECMHSAIAPSQIATTLGIAPYMVTKTVSALRGIPFEATIATIRGLAEIDRRIKGKGPSYTKEEVEYLLFDIRQSFFEAFQSKPLMQ